MSCKAAQRKGFLSPLLNAEQSLLCLEGHRGYDSHTAIRLLTLLFQLDISGFRQSKYLNVQRASSVTIEMTTTNNGSSTHGSAEAKLWITHLFFTYTYEKKFKSGQRGSTSPSHLEDAGPDRLRAAPARHAPFPREVPAEAWVLHRSLEQQATWVSPDTLRKSTSGQRTVWVLWTDLSPLYS